MCEDFHHECMKTVLDPDIATDRCVINSVLCFIKCKLSLLTTDMLTQLCCDKFKSAAIVEAQAMMHQPAASDERLIKRRGDDMASKAVLAIVRWFHEQDTTTVPPIVTDNLNELPSVDVHNIDASLLMSELSQRRQENCHHREMCENVMRTCTSLKGR